MNCGVGFLFLLVPAILLFIKKSIIFFTITTAEAFTSGYKNPPNLKPYLYLAFDKYTNCCKQPPQLRSCLIAPGCRPEHLWHREMNQAGNERMLILEGWHELDPYGRFQSRIFELNATLTSFMLTSLLGGMYKSSSGCLLALIVFGWVLLAS